MVRGQARFPALVIAVSAGSFYLALLVAAVLIGPAGWEENLREWMYQHTERAQFAMDDLLTLGEKAGPLLIMLLAIVLFTTKQRRASFFLLAGAGGAAVLGVAAKEAAGVFSSDVGDFPSGHASGSAGVATAFTLLVWDRAHRMLVLLAGIASVALYGLVLVATNWHGPSEIVGGWCLAVAWVSWLWLWLGAGTTRIRVAGISLPARNELRSPRWDSGQK
jgi:membrane-associated phospholipid phosphatase